MGRSRSVIGRSGSGLLWRWLPHSLGPTIIMMLFAAPCPLFGSVENLLPFTPANSNKSRIILASLAAIDVAFTLTTTQTPVHSRHVDSPLGGAIGVAKPVDSAVDSNCPYRSASGLPTTESNETVTGRVPENRCRVSATSLSLRSEEHTSELQSR